nr:hypothetical protein [uncultured Pseudogulbenkiania sp.]
MCIDFFDVCVLEAERESGKVRLVFGDFFEHEGHPVISHDLASDEAIDWAIEDLKRALDDVRKKAKRRLRSIKKEAQRRK